MIGRRLYSFPLKATTIPDGELIALFLVGSTDHRFVPTLAARCGFRTLVASWRQCEPQAVAVRVRKACEVDADGRARPLLGAIIIKPALIAVLSRLDLARVHGLELAASSGAVWSHYDASAHRPTKNYETVGTYPDTKLSRETVSPVATGYVAYGIVESSINRPLLRLAIPLTLITGSEPGTVDPVFSDHGPASAEFEALASQALEKALWDLNTAAIEPSAFTRLYRTIAPVAFLFDSRSVQLIPDSLCAEERASEEITVLHSALTQWLKYVWSRVASPAPLTLPHTRADNPEADKDEDIITDALFPSFFGTSQYIDTQLVPDASFVHLDPDLVPLNVLEGESALSALRRILCRRRIFETSDITPNLIEQRLVETGVGRTCVIDSVRLHSHEHFHDFTVMGIGLTPFSEGGFVEIGRKIDGSASMIRAWHRKSCAERLEHEGCRTGRVVAIIKLPSESMEMPDGKLSPICMIVRGFRCALRVKQLDPIVCSLHSTQHTPLISAYLIRSVHNLRFELGLPQVGGLVDDELLAREIELQGASQASLRHLLETPVPEENVDDWRTLVRRVRLETIDAYAPALLKLAKLRHGKELKLQDNIVSDAEYLNWFAISLGEQLAAWRRLRFLHDYHHPGVSRWQPESLYSLGENNISLLAEFPDLDTGLFVDDEEAYLVSTLQLKKEDVALLRQSFLTFHYRDALAAETAVRTLAMIMFRDDNEAIEASAARFRRSYKNA